METIHLEQDIRVLYVTAASFPQGIYDAHQRLHQLVPFSEERRYFGISRPENRTVIYRAAAEELEEGEAEYLHCDTLVLKKGNYACITVYDYVKDIPAIARTFETLLAHPDVDPAGYCVEWYYTGKDIRCMVRLAQQNSLRAGCTFFAGGLFFV